MNTLLPEVAVDPTNKDDVKPERFVISQGKDVFLIVTDEEGGVVQYELAGVIAKYTESSAMNGAVVDRTFYLILTYKNKPSVFLKGKPSEVKKAAVSINSLPGK